MSSGIQESVFLTGVLNYSNVQQEVGTTGQLRP